MAATTEALAGLIIFMSPVSIASFNARRAQISAFSAVKTASLAQMRMMSSCNSGDVVVFVICAIAYPCFVVGTVPTRLTLAGIKTLSNTLVAIVSKVASAIVVDTHQSAANLRMFGNGCQHKWRL